jgi:hypothetical protein
MVVIPAYFASTLAAARGSISGSGGGGGATKMSYGGHECVGPGFSERGGNAVTASYHALDIAYRISAEA